MKRIVGLMLACAGMVTANNILAADNSVAPGFKLVTLDPGHFHASLVQKFMYPDVDATVHVYAPGGDELQDHLKRVEGFNARTNDPTHWREEVYTGKDYLEKMLAERAGNVVVIAGNNAQKTDYILKAVQAGFNVLADKPMVITPENFPKLEQAFKVAESKHVLLYDIMTERFEITTVLQRELTQMPALFGQWQTGSAESPAITMESVHYFSKTVAGSPLKRPAWFFDVRQEGEGMQDVGTHLVDLVQWEAYPGQALNPTDVQALKARRWATPITQDQLRKVTGAADFPDYLKRDVKDGALMCRANGDITYKLRDIYARVSVRWNFETPAGGGDMFLSVVRGTAADLLVNQLPEQNYKPVLSIRPHGNRPAGEFDAAVTNAIAALQKSFPGVGCERSGAGWVVTVPDKYDVGHEAHFSQVTENYLGYLRAGKLPVWEVPNMLTKYATTMKAYEMSR